VSHPARLGDPVEYAALAVRIVENVMLNGETIRPTAALEWRLNEGRCGETDGRCFCISLDAQSIERPNSSLSGKPPGYF
jgi:hypothetical protein